MNSHRIPALILILCLLIPAAVLAETVILEGTVVPSATCEVYMPVSGTPVLVSAETGVRVEEGETLAKLRTVKVYAESDGTVTGIFAQPGDSADTAVTGYGAVVYMEETCVYTVSGNTKYAYDAPDNKFLHIGETVDLVCTADGTHTGTGVITALNGTSFTVEVQSGTFTIGETVNIFRGEAKNANRLGRGSISRKNPIAVSGTGTVTSVAVTQGQSVKRGDLLFETLDGVADGLSDSADTITAPVSGVIASVSLAQGVPAEKGSVAVVIRPDGAMRIKAQIPEGDLLHIAEGDPVQIEFNYDQETGSVCSGTVTFISAVAAEDTGSDEALYDVFIDFTPDAAIRYGMTATVTTLEKTSE